MVLTPYQSLVERSPSRAEQQRQVVLSPIASFPTTLRSDPPREVGERLLERHALIFWQQLRLACEEPNLRPQPDESNGILGIWGQVSHQIHCNHQQWGHIMSRAI